MFVQLDVIASRTTMDAMDVAQQCPQPTLNWLFADKDGHIGMQGGGWFPKRNPAISGLLPVAAWDEANHWQGRIESYYLPRIYDPPEGFIATANENINSPGDPMLVTQPLHDYRKRRIVERLKELPQATVTDMQKLLPPAALTIMLDIAPETAVQRKAVDRDRYERDLALQARVRESYRRQANENGWIVIDGERPKEAIAEDVFGAVAPLLSDR